MTGPDMPRLQKPGVAADTYYMAPHLYLVPAGDDLAEDTDGATSLRSETNLVDLDSERRRRRYRYHPAAGRAWLQDLFEDDDFDPLDPIA